MEEKDLHWYSFLPAQGLVDSPLTCLWGKTPTFISIKCSIKGALRELNLLSMKLCFCSFAFHLPPMLSEQVLILGYGYARSERGRGADC